MLTKLNWQSLELKRKILLSLYALLNYKQPNFLNISNQKPHVIMNRKG